MRPRHDFPPLRILGRIERTATPAELDPVVLRPGFTLPPSYCHFAQQYGYGLLCQLFLIFMPLPEYGCDFLPTRSQELARFFVSGVHNEMFEYAPDGSPELVQTLIPFGISENGHYLTWHPNAPSGEGEYAIYVVGTHFLSVTRAAANLYEFVEACLDERVKGMLGSGYAPLPNTFRPIHPGGPTPASPSGERGR